MWRLCACGKQRILVGMTNDECLGGKRCVCVCACVCVRAFVEYVQRELCDGLTRIEFTNETEAASSVAMTATLVVKATNSELCRYNEAVLEVKNATIVLW